MRFVEAKGDDGGCAHTRILFLGGWVGDAAEDGEFADDDCVVGHHLSGGEEPTSRPELLMATQIRARNFACK